MSRRSGQPRLPSRSAHPAPPTPAPLLGTLPAAHYVWMAVLLGAFCFLVYMSNLRRPLSADSVPARLLPFSILRQGNLDLDEFSWLRRLDPHPYFLRQTADGHWRSRYPVAVSVAVTPLYLPITWWLQRHHIDDDDVRFRLAAVLMERIVAALITAASVSLVFLAAATMTHKRAAIVVAVLYAFGTSTWAIGSQALWQHGPAALALAGLSLFLLLPDTRRNAAAAGTCAAMAVLARPTMAVFALLAAVCIWRERRSHLWAFLAVPLIGALAVAAYFNTRLLDLLAAIDPARRGFGTPHLRALLGLLVSPNRGLFVYVPLAALAVPALLRPPAGTPRWLAYARVGVAAYLLLYSAWSGWWGGHCYGPRFLTDLMPVLALIAIPIGEHLWRRPAGRVVVIGLAAWGVVVQGIGVYCDDNEWNALPNSVDRAPARLWDWQDPQILRAASAGYHGFDLVPLIWQTAVHPLPAQLRLLQPGELAGQIAVEQPLPLHYRRGQANTLRLQMANRSGENWPVFSDYGLLQVSAMYRWWSDGRAVTGEGGFIPLPRNLAAGESVSVQARIDSPQRPGTYELEIRVIQVLDVDRGTGGNATARVPVEIR